MGPRQRAGLLTYIIHGSSVDPSKVKNFQVENDWLHTQHTHTYSCVVHYFPIDGVRISNGSFCKAVIRITSATLFSSLVRFAVGCPRAFYHPPLGFYWLVLPFGIAFQTIETGFRIGQSKTRTEHDIFFPSTAIVLLSSDDIFSWTSSISTN